MQRRRFYARPDDIRESAISLPSDETHHLLHVLRMAPGDEAYVFDGCGVEYRCRVANIEGNRARLEVVGELPGLVESPIRLVLAQALAKGEKFDLIVQKASELGVSEVFPIVTANVDVRLTEDRAGRRLDRWRRISLEALKQSGRRRLVNIRPPMLLNEALAELNGGTEGEANKPLTLLFNEIGGAPIGEVPISAETQSILAFVGPEGGWEPDEVELIVNSGAKSITLGPRILRSETAALVAVALIQNRFGDLSRSIS